VQFAPAMMMNLRDAESSGLLGVGSRASYRLMLAGDADAISAFRTGQSRACRTTRA